MPKIEIAKAAVRMRSAYPGAFEKVTQGREKTVLGDVVGLTQFGVKVDELQAGRGVGAPALARVRGRVRLCP